MKLSNRSSAAVLGFVFVNITALTVVTVGYCQAPGDGGQHRQFHGHGPNAEFETRMLTKRLGLTAEQASQVEPILAEQDEQFKALKPAEGTQPDFKALHEQRKAIMEATDQKLSTVLSQEQLEKFEKMQGHHGPPRGNWGPKGSAPGA